MADQKKTLIEAAEDGLKRLFIDNADGTFSEKVGATITTGDIEIGAVEIKNATTDDRATVSATGALKTEVTGQAAVGGSLTGKLPVAIGIQNSGSNNDFVQSPSALADTNAGNNQLAVAPVLFDGASAYPKQRGNTDETILASAARTIATNSADFKNYNGRVLTLVIDVTVYTAGSITVTIQGKDDVSGKYYTLLASVALAATGTTVLRIGPGVLAAANLSTPLPLPRVWRASVAVGSADSVTYSVGASVGV